MAVAGLVGLHQFFKRLARIFGQGLENLGFGLFLRDGVEKLPGCLGGGGWRGGLPELFSG